MYQAEFAEEARKLTMNDHLRLAGTFYGLYAITSNVTPTKGTSTGLQVLETDGFRLQSYQSPTGIVFYLTGHPGRGNYDHLLKQIYQLYADYVLKNPFYELEQPIHCQQFDAALVKLLKEDLK